MWGRIPYSLARCIGAHTVLVVHKNSTRRSAVTLSYQIHGDDFKYDKGHVPIFLMHDLLGCKKYWSITGKILNDLTKRPVIAVDLRNHGSSPHANSHSYIDMAEDMQALLKKMDLKSASLVGYSMGGRVSMSLALMRPESVASLLVVDISPVSSCSHMLNVMPQIIKTMKAMDFQEIHVLRDAKKKAKFKLRKLIEDDNEMNCVLQNIGINPDTGKIGWICNLDVLLRSFNYIKAFPPGLLGKVYDGPILFIGGQHSEYIPPDDLPLIRELFPRAVVKYLSNTTHNLQTEDPKRFLELATHFFRQKDLRVRY